MNVGVYEISMSSMSKRDKQIHIHLVYSRYIAVEYNTTLYKIRKDETMKLIKDTPYMYIALTGELWGWDECLFCFRWRKYTERYWECTIPLLISFSYGVYVFFSIYYSGWLTNRVQWPLLPWSVQKDLPICYPTPLHHWHTLNDNWASDPVGMFILKLIYWWIPWVIYHHWRSSWS